MSLRSRYQFLTVQYPRLDGQERNQTLSLKGTYSPKELRPLMLQLLNVTFCFSSKSTYNLVPKDKNQKLHSEGFCSPKELRAPTGNYAAFWKSLRLDAGTRKPNVSSKGVLLPKEAISSVGTPWLNFACAQPSPPLIMCGTGLDWLNRTATFSYL